MITKARDYAGVDLTPKPEEKVDNKIRTAISAKGKSRLQKIFRAVKVRSFGCVHSIEIGMNDTHLYELNGDSIINRIKFTEINEVVFLDQYHYPLIKLNFPD